MDLKKQLAAFKKFASEGVWDIEIASLSRLHRLGVSALRVVQLVFRGFVADECPLHASALTFSTLMSIVPLLALSLALARGFGGDNLAKRQIREVVHQFTQSMRPAQVEQPAPPPSTNSVTWAATNAVAAAGGVAVAPETVEPDDMADMINARLEEGFKKVENISFTTLGGIGLVALLWTVISVLGRVEASFNRVWGVPVGRTLWRKFTDYVSVLVVVPLLVAAASSLSIVDMVSNFVPPESAEAIKSFLGSGFLKNLLVVGGVTLTFAFLIRFMPNTRVQVVPALVGGFVGALLFLLWLCICAKVQVGVAKAGKIYGSFAIVPVLLAWVYISWQTILFGAEAGFAVQNCTTYRMEQAAHTANVQARLILTLAVIFEAARAMLGKAGDNHAFCVPEFAARKRLSVRFLNDIVDELVRNGLLGPLAEQEDTFALLRSPDRLPVKEIVDKLMASGAKPETLGVAAVDPLVGRVLEQTASGIGDSLGATSVADLLAGEEQPA